MDHAGGGSSPNAGKEEDSFLETGGHSSYQDSGNHRQRRFVVRVTVVVAVMAITCLFLIQSSYPTRLFQSSFTSFSGFQADCNYSSCHANIKQENELEKTLRKAAMADGKTVIITTLNSAWTEPNSIFDLFLESFRIGNQTEALLKHVVVAALDQTAFTRCLDTHLHCYAVSTTGVNFTGEAFFMTDDYLKMMWRRIDFLRTVLQLGFDFVFTDADIMWLRNPFERFYGDGDFQIACDHYWFNSTDLRNSPNGGFNYVKSNNRTIEFYKYWYAGREYFPGKHDQDVLNMIKMNPKVGEIGVEIRFLETAYFGGFCEPSKDLDLVITMHANCCIGLENKIHDIKMVIDDWKRYTAPTLDRNSTLRSWTVPRICG